MVPRLCNRGFYMTQKAAFCKNISEKVSAFTNKESYRIQIDGFCKTIHNLKTSAQRFQIISERTSKLSEQIMDATTFQLHTGKYKSLWKGINTMKDCREMVIYHAIISEIRPFTVIELGSYTGGSAVWLADTLKIMDIEGKVFTVDIEKDFLHPTALEYPGVECITGDVTNIGEIFPGKMLNDLPHPWLVIEDCHVNTRQTMTYFAKYMKVGDYFAIEDTSPVIQEGGWGTMNSDFANKSITF